MDFKSTIMDSDSIKRVLVRISHEIVEKNNGLNDVVFLGIKSRGVPIANRLKENIKKSYSENIPVGILDTTNFRDDLKIKNISKKKDESIIDFDINNKIIVLVDDVLYTGRTIRAAIEAVFSLGRPKKIELAILVDRGHRELPIRPDFIGKNIPTSRNEEILVKLNEIDNEENVSLYSIN